MVRLFPTGVETLRVGLEAVAKKLFMGINWQVIVRPSLLIDSISFGTKCK